MNDETRADVELRKLIFELQIVALDQQATILALQTALLEIVRQDFAEKFAHHHAAEKSKRLAERGLLQTAVQTLQTVLDKYPRLTGLVH